MSDTAQLVTVGPKTLGGKGEFTAERFAQIVQMILLESGIVCFGTHDELMEKKPLIMNKQQPWAPDTHQMVKITIETNEYSETEHVRN